MYFKYLRVADLDETETDLKELGLSVRSYDRLHDCGIRTIEELFGVSEPELISIKQLGLGGIGEIKTCVGVYRANNHIKRVFPRKINAIDPLRCDEAGFWKNGESIFSNRTLRASICELGLETKLREGLELAGISTVDQLIVLSREEICAISPIIEASYYGILSKMRIFFLKNGISCMFPAEPILDVLGGDPEKIVKDFCEFCESKNTNI